MGNLICPKCDPDSKENVINISDQCIGRLTEDDRIKMDHELDDDEWMLALKCLDDVHSNKNELTIQGVETLLTKVEGQVGTIRQQLCSSDKLVECLKRYNNCMIKCKTQIDEFIDCVDKSRIDIMKEKIAEEERCRLAELEESSEVKDNELAKEFLKAN